MLQMRIAVSREQIAQRAGELLAQSYVLILEQYTFSTKFSSTAAVDIYSVSKSEKDSIL
jgi:hypothetical protein